jgi:electron transfer flavoprotein beta subunit
MGVDRAYLISDRAFAGADVLATARTLAQGIQYINDFDLIICGKQTTDGDTAQVGPEIAEHLHIPHVTNVTHILKINEKSIVLNCTVDEFIIQQEVTLPCVICVDANINTPRLPSYKIMKQRQPLPIQLITLKDLPIKDAQYYGLNASPTQILKIYSTEKNENKILHTGSVTEQATLMYRVLKDTKVV